jgi:hypothetical protein
MNQAESVASLQITGGTFTVNGDLTDTGSLSQSGGAVDFGNNNDFFQIAGDVTRTGGTMPGTVGALILNGTASQNFMDTSFNKLPGLTISNTSAAGVSLPAGSNVGVRTGGNGVTLNAGSTLTLLQGPAASFLFDRGSFTDNGTIAMQQLSPNLGNPTALITVGGTLTLGSTSAFNLTVTKLLPSAVYTFVTYATLSGSLGNVTINGAFPFTGAASAPAGPSALVVTLSASQVTTDTWTGAADTNFANAANWSTGAVPGAGDLAVIPSSSNNPTLGAPLTVAGLQVTGGTLTLNANLTVTGDFI